MKPEKYEAPEVEFVEMEAENIVCASNDCGSNYDDWVYTRCTDDGN